MVPSFPLLVRRAENLGCVGPNFGARCPLHRAKLRMLGPAQVTPMLGPSRLNLSQERASLTPVGFWLGQVGPLLSSLLFPGCGRYSSRSDSNIGGLAGLFNTFLAFVGLDDTSAILQDFLQLRFSLPQPNCGETCAKRNTMKRH